MAAPNFVIFLADDLGWGDLGCYGASDMQTPNLDRLAQSGTRFTNWYGGAPICSASRSALLTGRTPTEAGVPTNVAPQWEAPGLSPDVQTIPEALSEQGYQTYMAGKWHLGQGQANRPHHRGFDDWRGFLHGCVDYYSHTFYWSLSKGLPSQHDLYHNGEPIHRNGQYLTDLIADWAVEYLERAKEDGRPFFLYVPLNSPHYPMHGPDEAFERFEHLDEARQLTAAMVYTYDQAVGRVLDALERLDLRQNTCVFASSDHGPSREPRNWIDGRQDPFPGGSSGGLSGSKSSLLEGGIRLPGIFSWPGVWPEGEVRHLPAWHGDILPTFRNAATGRQRTDETIRRRDLGPILKSADAGAEPDFADRALTWTYAGQQAVRRGKWKLSLNARPDPGQSPPDQTLLVDLDADPCETTNLARAYPEVVDELRCGLA